MTRPASVSIAVDEIATDALEVAAAQKDEWGFYRARVPVTRTGIFEYADASVPGGVRREYRAPEEVFAPDSVKSLHGRPLVLEHPESGKVDPSNARTSTTGLVIDPEVDEENGILWATVVVQDAHSVELARSAAVRELSAGYLREIVPGDGMTADGQAYTHRQRGIRYNHVAQTAKGRAGSVCALPAFDAADGAATPTPDISVGYRAIARCENKKHLEQYERNTVSPTSEPPAMTTRPTNIAGKTFELAVDAADAVDVLVARLESLEDAAKAAKIANDTADFAKAVEAKVALLDAARGLGLVCDSAMADVAIQTAVITKLAPTAKLDGKTPAQIALRYEAEMDRAAEHKANRAAAEASHAQVAVDSVPMVAGKPAVATDAEPSAADVRKRMIAEAAARFDKVNQRA